MVALVRQRAAQAPPPEKIADLLTSGGHPPGDMSAAQIRDLGRDTLVLAGQVSYLLGKLAGLLEEEGDEPQGR
jgi:hypothetical protein